MKPGDLVKIMNREEYPPVKYVELYHDWMNIDSCMQERFHHGQIALVLESLEHQGGNGCKVLLPGGTVGWCGTFYLRVMGEE